MTRYQTVLYKVFLADHGGWDYTGEILFKSKSYEDPFDAMQEYDFAEPSHPNWFANMRTLVNGKVINEEIFDSSIHTINEEGDLV